MSQPWQPQPPQPQYGPVNPGNQPPVPQQPPGPPVQPGFGAPQPFAGPGQFPMQPGYPVQAPYGSGPQPRSGSPVGAFFLGFLVSFVVALIYSFVMYGSAGRIAENPAIALYLAHALLNGAAVGVVVGLVGRRSVGAQICGAVVAMLGTFFGYANGVVLIVTDGGGGSAFSDMMQVDPLLPAKAWWGGGGDVEVFALLGLVVAAAAAWGLAYAIGRRR